MSLEEVEKTFENFLKKNPFKFSVTDTNGKTTSQILVFNLDYFERTDGESILTENTENESFTKQIISRHLIDIPEILQVQKKI